MCTPDELTSSRTTCTPRLPGDGVYVPMIFHCETEYFGKLENRARSVLAFRKAEAGIPRIPATQVGKANPIRGNSTVRTQEKPDHVRNSVSSKNCLQKSSPSRVGEVTGLTARHPYLGVHRKHCVQQ